MVLCSTIIPTIGRTTLQRAVESVLAQDIDPELHEIIVVNDSGHPLMPADWLTSPRVKLLNTNRCERSVACNVGAATANGKYLKILHDDDYLLPGGLKALLDVAEASTCTWIYGGLNRVDNEGVFISSDRPEVKGNILGLLVAGEGLHLAPALINREAFFRVGCFDPQLKVQEDYDMVCRLALLGDFDRTDHVVASVRVGREGSSTDWSRVADEHRCVREKVLGKTGAFRRIRDSVGGDRYLRGRGCRAYLASALSNLRTGNYMLCVSRLVGCSYLAGRSVCAPSLWRGMLYN